MIYYKVIDASSSLSIFIMSCLVENLLHDEVTEFIVDQQVNRLEATCDHC